MTIAIDDEVEARTEIYNLADLLHGLGNIAPRRVRMCPPLGTATVTDIVRNKSCELIDGVLVEKAMGQRESQLSSFLVYLLNGFVLPQNLGIVYGPDATLEILTGLVRLPDVAFISWSTLPGRTAPKEPVPNIVPDLAVEVIREGDTPSEMARKRADYFTAGVRLVWMIDRFKLTASVYTAVDQFHTLTIDDALDGEDVLPGFSLKLTALFGELDRQG